MTMMIESQATRLRTETGFFTAMARAFAAYRNSRRTIRELGAMDDRTLRDIGLTRADVMHAAASESIAEQMTMLNRARSRRNA